MKRIVLVIISFVLISFSLKEKNNNTYQSKLILKSAYVFWKGTSPFNTHRGTVKLKSGSLTIINRELKSGEFIIDMTSIHNREGIDKLETHLKSADFFEVKKYPTSKFSITGVTKENKKIKVTGKLTIKDVTKEVSFFCVILENEKAYLLKSDVFKINRAEFNIKYMSKSFFKNLKDHFIDDEIEMSFLVRANKLSQD